MFNYSYREINFERVSSKFTESKSIMLFMENDQKKPPLSLVKVQENLGISKLNLFLTLFSSKFIYKLEN